MILKQRAALGPRFSLPHDTRNIVGTSGNVFERLLAREGRTSTLFNNSKNLASSSQELRPDIPGKTMQPESEMGQEPRNSSIPVPRSVKTYCGTYSHRSMINCTIFPISELHLENFLTRWNKVESQLQDCNMFEIFFF